MANPLLALAAITPISNPPSSTATSKKFVSNHPPPHLGNASLIGYGGSSLAVAINAACHTLDTNHLRLYSATGNFLYGAKTDRPLYCAVSVLRSTKTFETRQVLVTQRLGDGKGKEREWPNHDEVRSVLIMLADFMVPDRGKSLMTYSAKPTGNWEGSSEALTIEQVYENLLQTGKVSKAEVEAYGKVYALPASLFDVRYCKESIMTQNLFGIAKNVRTSQDHLPLPEKTTAYWIRSRYPLTSYAENLISVFFNLDEAINMMPLTHDHMFLQDASACSSLDFAIRLFIGGPGTSVADEENEDAVPLNLDEFHLKELKSVTGGQGKTYSEARLWNPGGRLVASMTQQCILRGRGVGKHGKKASL